MSSPETPPSGSDSTRSRGNAFQELVRRYGGTILVVVASFFAGMKFDRATSSAPVPCINALYAADALFTNTTNSDAFLQDPQHAYQYYQGQSSSCRQGQK